MKVILSTLIIFLMACSTSKDKQSNELNRIKEVKKIDVLSENGIKLSGTLNYVSKSDLVIIVAGSGPTDRDGNNNHGLKTDTYKLLSESLENINISSFRYDKRGIGNSTKVKEEDANFLSFVIDLDSIVKYFEKEFTNIHLMGHSEGALISTLSAQNNSNITSLILLAGAGKTFDKILIDQLSKFPKLIPLVVKHINEIKSNKELSAVNPILLSLFRPSVVPFLKSVLKINPVEELAKVKQQTLIIGGWCDLST